LHNASVNQQPMTRNTIEREVCLTGVMSEARVSNRNYLDTGEVEDGRSDATNNAAMEMAMSATPVAAESVRTTVVAPMGRIDNGQWRRRSEVLVTTVAPSNWRSHMERTMRQQAPELTQLQPTIGHQINLLEEQEAREEAQRRGMITWIHE
jgi:hypothetical protein